MAHRNIKAIIDIFRLTSITAAKDANARECGRNTNPPSSATPQMLNEQNFQSATAINVTDSGLSRSRNQRTNRLLRRRPIPTSTAESMKYDGINKAADATSEPSTPFSLYPKNVAALRLTGPGVICVSAMRFEKSSTLVKHKWSRPPSRQYASLYNSSFYIML